MTDSHIPKAISEAAAALLQPYAPGLTPDKLANAIVFQPEGPEQEKLLSRKEASTALNISQPTLDRMLKAGELKKVRVRGRAFVRQSEVSRIISGGVIS